MKVVKSVPEIFTSMPLSFTSSTSQVTTAPFLTSPGSANGSASSCLTPSEMRSFSTSTSSTTALTMSPFLKLSITCSPGSFQSRSDRWTIPSTSPSSPRNRPNSVLFLTSPSTADPTGNFSTNTSQGWRMVCFRPSEIRRFDFLGGRNDLAGVHVLLGPRHFRDVDQAFDARLQFHERAVVGDVGDAAGEARIERILRLDALPRIVQQLLHAERDAVGFVIDLDDLHLHRLPDGQNFGRVVDPAPGDIGDVQQAVDAAEINERTVIGDVLDDTVDDLTFFEILHQFLALLGAGLFQHGAARHHDVAAAAIHLE